jgi:hypothetical protein
MERLHVQASYTVGSNETLKRVDFVARIKDSSEGYKLPERAQRAAARREGVPATQIKITGCMSN